MSDNSNNCRANPEAAGSDQRRAGETQKAAYEIGYCKPPKTTRFKKGQSGNPKGAKKKAEIDDVRIVIEGVLAEPIKLRDGGKSRTVSKLEAMMRAQFVNALKGNQKAVKASFKLAQKTGLFNQAKPRSLLVIDPAGNAEQQMILRAFHAAQEALTNEGGTDG